MENYKSQSLMTQSRKEGGVVAYLRAFQENFFIMGEKIMDLETQTNKT